MVTRSDGIMYYSILVKKYFIFFSLLENLLHLNGRKKKEVDYIS